LRSLLEIPNDVLPETYFSADDNIGTSGLLSDNDIVSSLARGSLSEPLDTESDCEEEKTTPGVTQPTSRDSLEAKKSTNILPVPRKRLL